MGPSEVPSKRPREGTVLITGASGFIGGRIARRLAGEGRQVRCLVRASSDTSELARMPVEIVRGDLTDPRSLQRAVEGCREVLHCGALVSDWALRREILEANVQGTRNILEAARGAAVVRLVHLSSTDIYGYPGGRQIEESFAPRSFQNWYAQSKLLAEAEVRRARSPEWVILRPATVYGPGSKDVVAQIARAIRARTMLLIDGGRPIAGLCYVENLIDAALLALDCPAAAGAIFNIADADAVTWREFVDDLAAGLGCPRPRLSLPYGPAFAIAFALEHGYRLLRRAFDVRVPALLSRQAVQVLGREQDFSNLRARSVLGWEPRVGYREGLKATIAWLDGERAAPASAA